MAKTPILYKSQSFLHGRQNPMSEEYRGPAMGIIHPSQNLRNKSDYRILHTINPWFDTCFVIVERDCGTTISLTAGEVGKDLFVKSLERQWRPYYVTPGRAFRTCSYSANPGEPVEIKFYFFDTKYIGFAKTLNEDEAVTLKIVNEYIKEAFADFYKFETFKIDERILQKIWTDAEVPFKIRLKDELTHVSGEFILEENFQPPKYDNDTQNISGEVPTSN